MNSNKFIYLGPLVDHVPRERLLLSFAQATKKKSTCLAPHTVLMKHQGKPCNMSSLGLSTAHFSFLEPIPAMGPGNSFCYLLDKQTKVLVLFPRTSGQLHCFVGLSPSTLNTLYVISRNPYISGGSSPFYPQASKTSYYFHRTQCLALFTQFKRHAAKEAGLK